MPVVANHTEVAKYLQVTKQAVGQWAKKPGFPVESDGRFDTEKIQEWRVGTRKQQPRITGKPTTPEDQAKAANDLEVARRENLAKARGRELDNEERELNLAKKRGDLWARTLGMDLIAIIFARLRNTAMNLQKAGNVTGAAMIGEDLQIARRQIQQRIEIEKNKKR